MKYYKITNEDEIHYDLQYKDGLNVNLVPSTFSGKVDRRYIQFAQKDILALLLFGYWIREVTIPEGEKLVKEEKEEIEIFKARKIILGKRRRINLEAIKELIEEGADIHAGDDEALVWSVDRGDLEIVKYLIEKGADIHARDDMALIWAVFRGEFEIVKYLAEKGADIHARQEVALIVAIRNNHFEIVKYLAEKGVNIRARDNKALKQAIKLGHFEIAKYLMKKGKY